MTERFIVKRDAAAGHTYLGQRSCGGPWRRTQREAIRLTFGEATALTKRARDAWSDTSARVVRLVSKPRAPEIGDVVTWGGRVLKKRIVRIHAGGVDIDTEHEDGEIVFVTWDGNGTGQPLMFADGSRVKRPA